MMVVYELCRTTGHYLAPCRGILRYTGPLDRNGHHLRMPARRPCLQAATAHSYSPPHPHFRISSFLEDGRAACGAARADSAMIMGWDTASVHTVSLLADRMAVSHRPGQFATLFITHFGL